MRQHNRRDFIKAGIGASVALPAVRGALAFPAVIPVDFAKPPGDTPRLLKLNASTAPLEVLTGFFHMGTKKNPEGDELTTDSRSLLLNGKPWSPVMGEMHYSRYPQAGWRDELLKMKAGGIDIAATYVFWIHHEEVEGAFDWSGRRSLHHFVELCGQIGLRAFVRCGPWCHGEVRNGGFPDWLLKKGFPLRSNDPDYLEKVRRLYREIAGQFAGLLWKDGGPVVGIQVENEYSGPAEHLLTLKRIAREVGIDVPLYARTGWPRLRTKMPPGELLPFRGGYVDGFWDRAITPKPSDFLFGLLPRATNIAASQLAAGVAGNVDDAAVSPYLCCEIGGGMEVSYHRRVRITPEDIAAMALLKVGCGNNLQGYYMYHGGTNPEGRLSTLQESQASGYPNDLPVKSYDFQAPLGEFGQVNAHYHSLRRMHLFLRDYGELLATFPASLPEAKPANAADTTTLRWAARTDGHSGFIFVNNYQRLLPMPAKEGVQFQLKLRDTELRVPSEPFTVPADSSFFWPSNLDLGEARLIYATAQPICRVEAHGKLVVVFAQTKGVPSEFVFEGNGLTVENAHGKVMSAEGRLHIRHVKPGAGAALWLRTANGQQLGIVLLDEDQSLTCWKATLLGRERIFLTRSSLVVDGNQVRLSSSDPADLTVAIFPSPQLRSAEGPPLKEGEEGLFRCFTPPSISVRTVKVEFVPLQEAGPARQIPLALRGVLQSGGIAEAPSDQDFASAAVWRVKLPETLDATRNLLLRVHYAGDVARFYLDGQLLDDNFYNGNPFDLGLKRYAPDIYQKELLLKILPLRKDAPIYLAKEAWPDFGGAPSAVVLSGIKVIEQHEVKLLAQ